MAGLATGHADSAAQLVAEVLDQVADLRAARIAYALEFPLNANGEPDVDNLHANIRALKAEIERLTLERDTIIERCAVIADQWASDGQRVHGNGGPAAAIRALKEQI
jgi:hypothetical protein